MKDVSMVKFEGLKALREINIKQYHKIYDAAVELRTDLRMMHNHYANPEDRYVATVSIADDLKIFRMAVKKANTEVKEKTGEYVTVYDDYLRTNGGQYALARQMIAAMDIVSHDSCKQ